MIRSLCDTKLLRLVAAHGKSNKVTPCFFSTHHHQAALDSHSYASMLQQAIQNCDPNSGKSLHCHILKRGASLDLFAQNVLLNTYVRFDDSLDDASKLFDEMPVANTVSFVTLAQGFSRSHHFHRSLHLLLS
ncbi:putative pentatricopeptide repeat-containing protein mitochondrial [Spatholobus suberectus]|nr:putative pentatricopeptide repeat-containing protein mitochondrial [Spatholobus suberectus]